MGTSSRAAGQLGMDRLASPLHYLIIMLAGHIAFLHAGAMPFCTATVDKRFDGYSSLQFIRRGAVELFYGEDRFVLEPPTFWLCYPGPRIRFHVARGKSWNHRYVAFRGPGVAALHQHGLFPERPVFVDAARAGEYAARMDKLIAGSRSADPRAALRTANLLESLLLDISTDAQPPIPTAGRLGQIVTRLESGATFGLGYSALAHEAGLGESTLRRQFRAAMGVPLHRYVIDLRLNEARRLVADTPLPLKEIADRLGYNDVAFFSRQFSRRFGAPPAALRKARQ